MGHGKKARARVSDAFAAGKAEALKRMKEGSGKTPFFISEPLSEQKRKQLGLCEYIRPFRIPEEHSSKCIYRFFKRGADLVLGCAAMVILSPLMLGFMAAVVIEDPSASPIFKQVRIGKDGKAFVMYKLRSMRKDAENLRSDLERENQAQAKAFKIKHDPRVTKVGRIARKICVDEIFQLINVIRGEMSLVGPRPALPCEVREYDEYERQRLGMKPGLTCIWQVYPGRHEISFDDWVAMDLKYRCECSLLLDIRLLFLTVATIFRGDGD